MRFHIVNQNDQGPKTLQMQVNRKTYEPLLIHDKNILEDKSSKTLKLTIVDRANLSENRNR